MNPKVHANGGGECGVRKSKHTRYHTHAHVPELLLLITSAILKPNLALNSKSQTLHPDCDDIKGKL